MKMNKIALLSLITLSFAACNNGQESPKATSDTAEAAVKVEARAVEAKAMEAKTDDSATEIKSVVGIAECDEYINKYQACIAKMPTEARNIAGNSLNRMAEDWKAAAVTPEAKTALARACKQAHAAAKASMTDFDCQW